MLRIWGLTGHLFGRAIIIRGYMGFTWEQSEVDFGGPNLNSSSKGAGYQNGLHGKWTRSDSGKRGKGCWMYNERRDMRTDHDDDAAAGPGHDDAVDSRAWVLAVATMGSIAALR